MARALLLGSLLALGPVPGALSQTPAADEIPPPAGELLVVHSAGASLGFVDLQQGRMTAQVTLQGRPHEIALSPDGAFAAVADYGGGRLFLVDASSRRRLETLTLLRAGEAGRPYHRLHGIALLSRSQALVTAEEYGELLLVDLEHGAIRRAVRTAADMSHMVLAHDGGKRALVANKADGSLSAIDLQGGKLVKVVITGAGAQGMALRPGSRQAWVTNTDDDSISIVDLDQLEEIAELPCPDDPVRIAFSADGRRALVSHYRPGTASIWDAEERALLHEVALPLLTDAEADAHPLPPHKRGFLRHTPLPVGLLVHPDGRHAYLACTRADRIVELDLLRGEVRRLLPAGREPDGLAFRRR